jgi:hypothetical protein
MGIIGLRNLQHKISPLQKILGDGCEQIFLNVEGKCFMFVG